MDSVDGKRIWEKYFREFEKASTRVAAINRTVGLPIEARNRINDRKADWDGRCLALWGKKLFNR